MREVFAWQGLGWPFRFAAFWFFLEAFGLDGSIGNVMLVMSVQAIANIIPFTPGGAGAQQALLVATLQGPTRAAVLSFSVGTQIAMAAWSVVLGFGAILLVFRTTDWRGLIREAREDAEEEEKGGAAEEEKPAELGVRRCGGDRRNWTQARSSPTRSSSSLAALRICFRRRPDLSVRAASFNALSARSSPMFASANAAVLVYGLWPRSSTSGPSASRDLRSPRPMIA